MSVKVSPAVLEGIEAVRDSGETNMLDRPAVAKIASDLGFPESALWVHENRELYAEGVFHGFEVVDDAGHRKG